MPAQKSFDFERQIEFDFCRATEIAALNTLQWLGKGQKEKADEAAKLETELRENYPMAISHNGLLLTDLLDKLPGNGSGTSSTQTKNTKP